MVLVDQVLLNEVDATPETHPATRDSMMKLLMAVDKRDKFRFFGMPVTEQMVSGQGNTYAFLLFIHRQLTCKNCRV
jgi:hypothetical protein